MEHIYINTNEKNAVIKFSDAFYLCLSEKARDYSEIVFLCIGTDRATGDCLGPITGEKIINLREGLQDMKWDTFLLEEINIERKIKVYGTLEQPVHAKNLVQTISKIYINHLKPLVVAIDASLGKVEHVGYVTVGHGSIKPGAGLNKNLPEIGDIFITGIVNFFSESGFYILQNTRLNSVVKMSNIIYKGILVALLKMNAIENKELG